MARGEAPAKENGNRDSVFKDGDWRRKQKMVDCDGEEQLKSCRKIQGDGGVAVMGWKTTTDLNSNFKGSKALKRVTWLQTRTNQKKKIK